MRFGVGGKIEPVTGGRPGETFKVRAGHMLTVDTHAYDVAARGHGPFVTLHTFSHTTDWVQSLPRSGVMMTADDARLLAAALVRAADRC